MDEVGHTRNGKRRKGSNVRCVSKDLNDMKMKVGRKVRKNEKDTFMNNQNVFDFLRISQKTYTCDFLTLTNTAAMNFSLQLSSFLSLSLSFLPTKDILDYLFTLGLIGEDRNLSLCGPTKVQRRARGLFF